MCEKLIYKLCAHVNSLYLFETNCERVTDSRAASLMVKKRTRRVADLRNSDRNNNNNDDETNAVRLALGARHWAPSGLNGISDVSTSDQRIGSERMSHPVAVEEEEEAGGLAARCGLNENGEMEPSAGNKSKPNNDNDDPSRRLISYRATAERTNNAILCTKLN